MNSNIIAEIAHKTQAGSISFPEAVSQLLTAGVEYYHVDYVGRKKHFTAPMAKFSSRPSSTQTCRRSLQNSLWTHSARIFWTANGKTSFIASSLGARWRPGCKVTLLFSAANESPILDARATSTRNGFQARSPRLLQQNRNADRARDYSLSSDHRGASVFGTPR